MRKSQFTEEQIIGILTLVAVGQKVGDVCRQHGISDATYYRWKAHYGGLAVRLCRWAARGSRGDAGRIDARMEQWAGRGSSASAETVEMADGRARRARFAPAARPRNRLTGSAKVEEPMS